MKVKTLFAILIVISMLLSSLSFAADDGPLFTRNISRTPGTMTGASSMSVMSLYVPAQDPQGEPPLSDDGRVPAGEIGYFAGDCKNTDTSTCELIYSRPEAKPLIITYNDGVGEADLGTGAGFGQRDAFAALSLDDGATWKNVNLSDSALRSSINLKDGHAYPGDVFKLVHQVEGNQVVAAWISRYCESGSPLYAWADETLELDATDGLLVAYPELDHPVNVIGDDPYQLYTDDLFGVGGSQGSVDYTAQGFPSVGEIPYGCVWTNRGTLEQDLDVDGNPLFNSVGDPVYDITWRTPERLTSGRRDPHQISITSSPGAGFIIFWQEDPDGLRPGKGLGPGEGWSGAIANSKTDIWYSYIDLAHFGDVCTDTEELAEDTYCTPGTLGDYNSADLFLKKPKAAVPFAVPRRITDNNKCEFGIAPPADDLQNTRYQPYCYADFDGSTIADLCETSADWDHDRNPDTPAKSICVAEDGRLLTGRTASTRVRAAMKSYDSDGDGAPDSAWVLFGSEKMKALGTVGDEGCDPTADDTCTVYDIGKNMWYYTFEFDKPALGTQGMMLNSPALSPETGEPFVEIHVDEWGNEVHDTEIARRFNLMVNSPAAMQAENTFGTAGILLYKEGILFQGGPADIFTRRVVIPEPCVDEDPEDGVWDNAEDCFDPAVDNPFAYENVVCDAFGGTITPEIEGVDGEGWLYKGLNEDGTTINPNYVRGLCAVQGTNVSGTTLVRCSDVPLGETCAEQFPYSSTYEEWFSEDSQIQIPKVLEWRQCGSDSLGTAPLDGCDLAYGLVEPDFDNLNDPSWANPYDVSKGHRGFIDGDFVMMMYATAANWKAGTVGNEAYQLYIRRSFDGGLTWTTLPGDYTHWSALNPGPEITSDGTTTCELYGGYGSVAPSGLVEEYSVCTDYAAGAFEQGRNVSQLAGTRVTVLDPRYSPSGGMLKKDYTKLLCYDETAVPIEIGQAGTGWVNCGATLPDEDPETTTDAYPEEIRDPSGFFATFETGDNSVVDIDTATVPLDMYYSRAFNFGDDWDEQDICALADTEESWYPSAKVVCTDTDGDGINDPELRWDWLENGDDLATEASVFGNPNGDRFYTVWNQELPVGVEIYTNMDSEFRRIFFNFTSDAYPWAEIVAAVPTKGGGKPDSMLSASTAADAMPADSIVSGSTIALSIADGDTLTLVGTGRDYDHIGDGELTPMWFDDRGTVLCTLDEAASFEECEDTDPNDGICDNGCVDDNGNKICDDEEVDQYACEMATEVSAADMEPGTYKARLKVMDDEGNWSPVVELAADIWVANQLYNTYLPLVTR